AETGVPDGYSAIPLVAPQAEGALKLCVLTRKTPDPVGGHFVLLRELHDARVFLGCVTDAAGQVREWLELWVQNTDGLEASLPAYRESFSNFSLDSRWTNQAQTFRALQPATSLVTGWEEKHPSPIFIDLGRSAGVVPKTEPGGEWNLCRDDQALEAAGLPGYSTSLARYLYQPGVNGQGKVVP